MRFDSEEASDDADLTLAANGFGHGFAGGFALLVQVSTDEEQAAILSCCFAVEGCHWDAFGNRFVDERGYTRVASDGSDGVVFLGDGSFDCLPKDLSCVLVARDDPIDRSIVGL